MLSCSGDEWVWKGAGRDGAPRPPRPALHHVKEGRLLLGNSERRHLGNERFELSGGYLQLVRDASGAVTGFTLTGGHLRRFPFYRVSAASVED